MVSKDAHMKVFSYLRRGQTAIILTLALPSLIAAAILGIDATTVFVTRIRLQRSVEAAVLAGAGYLPSNPSRAIRTARTFAGLDGLKSTEIVSTRISSDRASITMSARRAAPGYFARAIGLAIAPISATATARVVPAMRARAAAVAIRYEPTHDSLRTCREAAEFPYRAHRGAIREESYLM